MASAILSALEGIPTTLLTSDLAVTFLKISFAAGLGVYLLFLPFYGSKKSFWDPLASRKITLLLRMAVSVELLLLAILLYFTIAYGSPIRIYVSWEISKGLSWIYSYPRPVVGIVLISQGLFGSMHRFSRIACISGCMLQLIEDATSAIQVYQYYNELGSKEAPSGNYTATTMYLYFLRDIASFGISNLCMWYCLHLTLLIGLTYHPWHHYSLIAGGDLDRCDIMRNQRELRKLAVDSSKEKDVV